MKLRKRRAPAPANLSAVDEAIIDILRENGRATNQEIADRLSISAATVSGRLHRLEENKAMRVVAVADFAACGYNVLIATGIKVTERPVMDVARDLAQLPEVFSIHVMNGDCDIEALVILHEFDEINAFLLDHVANIPGISEVRPAIAADIAKFEFNVAPL
jgi:Lrp/AsnC family transcriptional regulator, leucine-responsive regulatory protein